MDPSFVLPLDAFLRSAAVNRAAPHALFLGAGASVSSGVQTAARCIWQWKHQIFLSNQAADVVPLYREISLPSVQQRVQQWLDAKGGYPAAGAPEEYGFYAERCYELADDRTRYFQALVRDARPGPGYRLLALLAKASFVRSVWTTNFDALGARAAGAEGLTVVEVGDDSAARLHRARTASGFLHVALHGDFRYDALRNTPEELREQNALLEADLVDTLADTTLIVVGYSGRDRSVMRALARAYKEPGVGRLVWCGYQDETPAPEAETLVRWARERGREAFYVRTNGFDDLMQRLATHCLPGEHETAARAVTVNATPAANAAPPFRIEHPHTVGLIKSNAFPVRLPAEVLQVAVPAFAGEGAWAVLRAHLLAHAAGTRVAAVPQGGKVLALGVVDDVARLFAGPDVGPVERVPISERDLGHADGAVVSLLTQALVRAVASARGLESDGEKVVWEPGAGEPHAIAGVRCRVRQAARLALRRQAGADYALVQPTIHVTDAAGAPVAEDVDKEAKRQILGRQWNQKFNDALNAWAARLLPKDAGRTFEFPAGAASTFAFDVGRVPAFAKLVGPSPHGAVRVEPKVERHVRHTGTQLGEPALVFASRRGGAPVSDPHPIRGLVENRPYDHALTARGLRPDVRLGVIAPAPDGERLATFLAGLHQRFAPESKQEYLLPYPGFAQAFGAALDVPDRDTGAWYGITEPARGCDVRQGALLLRRQIQQGIDALVGTSAPAVVLVLVPSRWRAWEHYELDGEHFDLHDFIKAYAIQRGVATQFLREETLGKRYRCEVAWWLGLSLYVKAMRTPWVLEELDRDTAFVGLGFSLDPGAARGRHVLLGCSHIYSADGLGLTYRLSKIEDGTARRGNPFMSRADARRMGETAAQLFFDAHGRLPARVVLHRKTPFRAEERDGLLEGLHGVRHVDLLEINVDPMLRYVASRRSAGGAFQGDGYPIRRGTAVVVDRNKALLWVHGTADPVTPGAKPYYQGKSRIPAPLVVRRHHGTSDFDVLAREILGLSKMNWNSFDMYTKLPATIESSNRIARIGALIERTQPASYDYRLFI